MPVTNTVLQTDLSRIPVGGKTRVTLAFTAEPRLTEAPADVVLAVDTGGRPIPAAGLEHLVRTLCAIPGCRVGICTGSCRDGAVCPLTDCTEKLLHALERINGCRCGGFAGAVTRALELLKGSCRQRILVSVTRDASGICPCAEEKSGCSGVECFAIGYRLSGCPISEPTQCHLVCGWEPEDFRALAVQITGALRPVIRMELNPEFTPGPILSASGGNACIIPPGTVQWRPGTLGLAGPERACLTFEILHTGKKSGPMDLIRRFRFSSPCQPEPEFPSPELTVGCGTRPACPDPCKPEPCPTDRHICACQVRPDGTGRMVYVHVTLRDICPNRRVALAVVLFEDSPDGSSTCIGRKILTVPAHPGPGCRDIRVKCIPFVVPDPFNISDCDCSGLCGMKKFHVQIFCNYLDIDSDECCRNSVVF